MKPRKPSRPTTAIGPPAVPQPAKALADSWQTANQAPRPRKSDCGLGGLIPPHEMFGRVLPGPRPIEANLPFEERVERAWARLKLGFEEPEHDRLREVLVERLLAEGRHRASATGFAVSDD
jgi:hypothetical protein